MRRVYLAKYYTNSQTKFSITNFFLKLGPSAGGEIFVLKDVPQSDFKYLLDLYRGLRSRPYLRLLYDTVPEQSMLVYDYFTDDLLSLIQKDLPIAQTKRSLKHTLHGLAALHEQDIVHTGKRNVKANSIEMDWEEDRDGINVTQVQPADIEDATHMSPECDILGIQVGNMMWRSPEAHTQGRVNKPSDMFSFGVVCIYAVIKRVIFAVSQDELTKGVEPLSIVLERQIYSFGDEDELSGLLKHLGDSPWCEVLEILRDGFNEESPDLTSGLTNFDTAKRVTAQEALAHKWFGDV